MKKKFSKKEIAEFIELQGDLIDSQREEIKLLKEIAYNYKKSNDGLFEFVEKDWDKLTPYQIMSLMMLDKDKKIWIHAKVWDLYHQGKIKLKDRHVKVLTILIKGKSIAATGLELGVSTDTINGYLKEVRRIVKQYEQEEDLTLDYDINKLSKPTREMVVLHRLHMVDLGILTKVRQNISKKKFSKVSTDAYNKKNKAKNTSIVEDEFFREENQ